MSNLKNGIRCMDKIENMSLNFQLNSNMFNIPFLNGTKS